MPTFSVIIPVKNSSDHIQSLCINIINFFNELNIDFELILCDDQSDEDTQKSLHSLKEQYPQQIQWIRLSKEYGQHFATYAGLLHQKGQYIFTCDDDILFEKKHAQSILEQAKHLSQKGLLYFVNDRYDAKAKMKFLIVRSFILLSSHRWPPGYGASQRLFTRQLAEKVIAKKHPFCYLDSLLIQSAQPSRFHPLYFKKIKSDFLSKRYTHSERWKLLLLPVLIYNLPFWYVLLPLLFVVFAIFKYWLMVIICILLTMVITMVHRYMAKNERSFMKDIQLL